MFKIIKNIVKTEKSDEKLFEEFKSGNSAAFEELYKRHSKNLTYYLFKMLNGNKAKAEDFLHDIFFKLLKAPHLFDTSKNFKVWLYSSAYNKCKNEYRKIETHNTDAYDFEEYSADNDKYYEKIDFGLFIDKLNYELEQLTYENKSIFLLRHKENYSIKDISEIVGCPEGTVKSRLYYTILKLSKKLKHFNPHFKEN